MKIFNIQWNNPIGSCIKVDYQLRYKMGTVRILFSTLFFGALLQLIWLEQASEAYCTFLLEIIIQNRKIVKIKLCPKDLLYDKITKVTEPQFSEIIGISTTLNFPVVWPRRLPSPQVKLGYKNSITTKFDTA